MNSKKRRAQTSLEFMIMLLFIMLVFTGFYSFFVEKQVVAQEEQEALFAESIANRAAFEIKMALTQGDGYTRNVTLPAGVSGNDYDVTVSEGLVQVNWSDRNVIRDAVVDSVNGEFAPGENRVRNRGGEIYVD